LIVRPRRESRRLAGCEGGAGCCSASVVMLPQGIRAFSLQLSRDGFHERVEFKSVGRHLVYQNGAQLPQAR
jgi:hypothetical protein